MHSRGRARFDPPPPPGRRRCFQFYIVSRQIWIRDLQLYNMMAGGGAQGQGLHQDYGPHDAVRNADCCDVVIIWRDQTRQSALIYNRSKVTVTASQSRGFHHFCRAGRE